MDNGKTPAIGPALAIALCEDEYTGMPALDDPSWAGATDASRCAYHEADGTHWGFCWNDESMRLDAVDEEGNGAYSLFGLDGRNEWVSL